MLRPSRSFAQVLPWGPWDGARGRCKPVWTTCKRQACREIRVAAVGRAQSDEVCDVAWQLLNGRVVELLDILQHPLVLLGHKVDGDSLSSKTSTTANTVEVVLGLGGQVVVDDQGYLRAKSYDEHIRAMPPFCAESITRQDRLAKTAACKAVQHMEKNLVALAADFLTAADAKMQSTSSSLYLPQREAAHSSWVSIDALGCIADTSHVAHLQSNKHNARSLLVRSGGLLYATRMCHCLQKSQLTR